AAPLCLDRRGCLVSPACFVRAPPKRRLGAPGASFLPDSYARRDMHCAASLNPARTMNRLWAFQHPMSTFEVLSVWQNRYKAPGHNFIGEATNKKSVSPLEG